MKPNEESLKTLIDRHLPTPSPLELTASRDRLLHELRATPPHRLRPRIADAAQPVAWWRPVVSLAAAAALIALVATVSVQQWAGLATVEAADGSRYALRANTALRSNDAAGTLLTLKDGSRVEMRSQSELSLERADDGVAIRLRTGDIIVDAVRQPRDRHLYVRTIDVDVAVVGTMFLVSAGDSGSRVAVIEGEVRVREGATETKLRPGQQVATSPTVAARPIREDVAWSRYKDTILAAFAKGIAETSGPLTPVAAFNAAAGQAAAPATSQEFEEAAVRPCDPDNLPPTPAGARGGGANSFQMTPGRTYALCMTVATLIRTAYGYGPADLDFLTGGRRGRGPNLFNTVYGLGVEDGVRVRGGPDWARTERYTIDAVASGPADADTMRGPMLRALLERRFQLKAHIESEQVPAFSLAIAPGGLKMKPVVADNVNTSGFVNTAADATGSACEAQPIVGRGQPVIIRPAKPGERQPPPPSTPGEPVTLLSRNFVDVRKGEKPTCGLSMQRNGPNQVVVGGGVTLAALGQAVAGPLGGVQVLDKTGNTDKFNFVLEFVVDENTPGPRFLTPRPAPEPSDVPRAATILTAVEEQLGLRLDRTSTPREFIVIDAIERPGAN